MKLAVFRADGAEARGLVADFFPIVIDPGRDHAGIGLAVVLESIAHDHVAQRGVRLRQQRAHIAIGAARNDQPHKHRDGGKEVLKRQRPVRLIGVADLDNPFGLPHRVIGKIIGRRIEGLQNIAAARRHARDAERIEDHIFRARRRPMRARTF